MKKILKIIIPILALSLLGYLGYSVVTKMQYKSEVSKTLQSIPNFSFKTLDNTIFTNAELVTNTPTVFIYFNTECDFCQHEAQSIGDNLAQFIHVRLLFVSTEPIETIRAFAKTYNLLTQQNITFLYDSTHTFSNRFDANSIPYILIYNKKQELVKKHKGQLRPKAILKALIPANPDKYRE